ncbi:pentapeptide repeat-containing protein [Tolypothrix tenuis PCC 7101]|uniref:Pentapeptide repeat-containing protein n=1 Tax=Tolypothrix tenuis PCC 7101 TaxID=231146 RepID=A0A1Z4MY07_9CYAN|nr:caspase family protein [Aulosira sp. FACHB-113]BAY98377.1 pentapeptide repeat-containing protein [Tolypothrix tenuis PCC 7101]BAZ77704.1 pentapeptide repeat-containing protein [Aulosira laxa NIES-50]
MEREALVIGINRYPTLIEKASDRPPHLQAPAIDAEAIAQVLETYGKFHVERLPAAYNQDGSWFVDPQQQLTIKELETAIVQLFNPPGRSIPDTALLFFAGHGLRKDIGGVIEGFLGTSDTCPLMGDWGLSLDWLRKLLQSSPVRQQIVWLDCCHSGEFINFHDADPGSFETKDRCLIAASRGFEVAYEDLSSNHGILSGALVEALKPENHAEDWVTNYSLVDLVQQQLKTARQRPIFHNTGGEIILTGQKEKIDRAVLMAEFCPYKGLAAFEFNDSDPKYFYGRTALTDSLLENIRQGNFLAVIGASGSGKSSVVKAGLLYQLKLGKRLGGSDQWVIKTFRPGKYPMQSLARVFGHGEELATAEELLNKGASGLTQLIQTKLRSLELSHELEPDANTQRFILVIDQLEEVFTLCQNERERQRFFECFLGALNNSLLTVVVTMRADFFGKCAEQEYAGLAQKIQANLITVTPMNKKELTEAITQPAYQVGLEVQRELVEQMLADVEGPGTLPLLQYTLTELWRKREVNRLTLAEYSRLGGVKGTLQKRADEVYDAFETQEEKATAKRIFIELTHLGEGIEDTRRQVFKTELINSQESAAVVEQVLSKLADARLVVTSELQARGESEKTVTVVDVAHEALIRYWPKLRSWVTENRVAIRIERKIEAAAQEWESKNKSKDYLFTGPKLAEAENFLQEYGELGLLSHLASEFVQKSIQQRRRNRWFQLGAVASFVAVVAIGAIASTIFGLESRKQEAIAKEQAQNAKTQEAKAKKFAEESRQQEAIAKQQTAIAKTQEAKAREFAKESRQQEAIAKQQTAIAKNQEAKAKEFAQESRQQEAIAKNQEARATKFAKESHKQEVIAKQQAKIASLREKAANIKNLLLIQTNVEPLILAIQATGESQSSLNKVLSEVQSSLSEAIEVIRERNIFSGHIDNVNRLAFSPDGKYIVSSSRDNTVRLWDTNGKLLHILNGHTDSIRAVAFSSDSKYIVTGSDDKTLRLWDTNGKLLHILNGHTNIVNTVAFSPNGKYIVSGSDDNTLRLWNISGQLLHILKDHTDSIRAVAFSPDGKYIVSGSDDNTLRLWDISGQLLHILNGHTDSIRAVAFSPDGKHIVSGSEDSTLRLWDVNGQLLHTLNGHTEEVNTVAFSPDGKHIVSGSEDSTLRLWDTNGNLLYTFNDHTGSVNAVAFSPDGKYIVSGSDDKTLKLWDTNGDLLYTLDGHTGSVNAVAFSPDGKYIVSGSEDKTLRLWDTNGDLHYTLIDHTNIVNAVVFSPNGKYIVSDSSDNTLKLWNINGKLLHTLNSHTKPVLPVAFSPDGKYIVSGSSDNTLKLWDTNGNLLHTLNGHTDIVNAIVFSPNGKYIVSGSFDNTLRLWDTNGDLLYTLNSHTKPVVALAFSPDGKYIISGSYDKTLNLWDANGKLLHILKGHTHIINAVAFSPDGKYIVSGSSDKTLRLWDTNGKLLHILNGHTNIINAVAFSPDSKYIVSSSFDKTLRLWDTNGKLLHILNGHTNIINAVAFSPDGKYIVSGSFDNTLRLWDTNGKLLHTLNGHTALIKAAAFSPDGKYIVSGSEDNTVRLWLGGNWQDWLKIGCDRLHNHPALVQAKTDEAKGAAQTCLNYANWSNTEKAQFLVNQGQALSQLDGDIKGANAKFNQARKLDPSVIIPR